MHTNKKITKNQFVIGVKTAFTLAEVLITLGIIGVVAAITLPALITNVQARIRSEQIRTAKYKFTKATDEMKSLDLIGPYENTESFINELKKHLKIAKICPPGRLEGCWPTTEVTIDNDGNTFEIKKAITGKQFKMPNNEDSDYTSDNIGIVTADGTPMVISYNKKCKPLEPEKTYGWTTEDNKPVSNATAGCVAAVMDINGSKKPNKLSEDVVLFNAMGLGSGCGFELGGKCYSALFSAFTPLTKTECEASKDKLGIKDCMGSFYGNSDYWAGAVKACGGVDKMPTREDLAKIASYIFIWNIGADTTAAGNYNLALASKIGWPDPGSNTFWVWTNEEDSSSEAHTRYFGIDRTGPMRVTRNYTASLALCLLD